jgi:hypothetical protein
MGTRSTFLGLLDVTAICRCPTLSDWSGGQDRPGNSASDKTVPETDTGGLVEHTQAFERTVLKELGKLPP